MQKSTIFQSETRLLGKVNPGSKAEQTAHYRAVRARLWGKQPAVAITRRPEPAKPIVTVSQQAKPLPVAPKARDWLIVSDLGARAVTPINVILDAVCAHFCFPLEELRSARRDRGVVKARHVAAYLLHRMREDLSLPQIGRALNRDHTIVYYATERIAAQPEVFEKHLEVFRSRIFPHASHLI